ncbi:MAG TPA: AraC family transcriptional regulator [Opitutaceae bacterium]
MSQARRPRNTIAAFRRIGAAPSETTELFDFLDETPMWVKDREGYYQWVNVAFLLNFGLGDRAEIIGRTDFDVCGEVLAHQYRLDDECVLRGERIISRVELVGRFDHTARWSKTSKVPLHDERRHIVGTAGVTRPLSEHEVPSPAHSPLGAAIQLISQNLAKHISNRDMAQAYGLSARAFERHFRSAYRTSPHDYVRRIRVRKSCRELVFSRKSIAEISSECGFADQSHFAKAFQRIMRCTPSEYRARYMR